MKRKLALILACALIAVFASGCISTKKDDKTESSAGSTAASETASGDNSNVSDTSDTSGASNTSDASSKEASSESKTESNTESKTESSKTDEGSKEPVYIIDDDGNIVIDLDDISDWEDIDDESDEPDDIEEPEYSDGRKIIMQDLSYQMIYLAPDGFDSGIKLPAAYYITSTAELEKFIADNTAAYSLATEHTNDDYISKLSFVKETKRCNDDFFLVNDICVVVATYKNGTDCDVGDIYEKDGKIVVDIGADTPSTFDAAAYVCFIIPTDKGAFAGKDVTATVTQIIYGTEEE